jgi:hypothetical protein
MNLKWGLLLSDLKEKSGDLSQDLFAFEVFYAKKYLLTAKKCICPFKSHPWNSKIFTLFMSYLNLSVSFSYSLCLLSPQQGPYTWWYMSDPLSESHDGFF